MKSYSFYPPLDKGRFIKMLYPIPKSYCELLISKNIIISKKIGKKTYISEESVNEFLTKFNLSNYVTVKECNERLSNEGLKDDFILVKRFGVGRSFDFDINSKQLIEKGYLELDGFIEKYIEKNSLEKCILRLKKEKETNEKTTDESSRLEHKEKLMELELNKLLQPKIDKWERDLGMSKLKKIDFNIPKPILSDSEIKSVEKKVNQKLKQKILKKKKDHSLKMIKNIIRNKK